MRFISIILIILTSCLSNLYAQKIQIDSKLLNRSISLIIPNSDTTKTYLPLIYFGDQTQIELASAITNHLHQTTYIPPIMVIGISDFSNGELAQQLRNYQYGQSNLIMKFLSDELIPYLEQNYKLHPYRILAGHREAGAFVFTTMMEKDIFQAYFCFAPTIYQLPNPELSWRSFLVDHFLWDDFLYISQGFGDDSKMKESLEISRLLKAHSVERKIDYHFRFFDHLSNASLLPESMPDALRKLFADLEYSIMLEFGGIEALYEKKENLERKYGFDPLELKIPKIPVSRALLNFDPQMIPVKFDELWRNEREQYDFRQFHLVNLYNYFEAQQQVNKSTAIMKVLNQNQYGYQFKKKDLESSELNNYHQQARLNNAKIIEVVAPTGLVATNLTLEGATPSHEDGINKIHFDGQDDFARIDSGAFSQLTGSFSVATWIKPSSKARFEAFISQAVEGEVRSHWRVGFGPMPDSQWGLSIWNNAWKDYLVNENIPLNQWTHLVVAVDQSLGKVHYFMDGKPVGLVNQVFPLWPTKEPVILGRNNANGLYFEGDLSGVVFYRRVLSASEAETIFKQQRGQFK